jgi:hypothetical protein
MAQMATGSRRGWRLADFYGTTAIRLADVRQGTAVDVPDPDLHTIRGGQHRPVRREEHLQTGDCI